MRACNLRILQFDCKSGSQKITKLITKKGLLVCNFLYRKDRYFNILISDDLQILSIQASN